MGALVWVYWPALGGAELWDDGVMVTQNQALQSPRGLVEIWTRPGTTFQYYPLTYTSFWLEYRLWGNNLRGYRVVNLLLHLLGATLLWRVLRQLHLPASDWIAAAYALHPMQVESVAWVAERKNVLCGVLFWGCCLALTAAAQRDWSARWRGIALALFTGALLAKTAAVPLPLLLASWLWFRRELTPRAALTIVGPFALVAALAATWTTTIEHDVIGAAASGSGSEVERLLRGTLATCFYLARMTFPWPVCFVYPRLPAAGWGALAAIALGSGVVLLMRRARSGQPGWLAGTVVTLALLLPTLGFIRFAYLDYADVADRFVYLALAPWLALIAAVTAPVWRRLPAAAQGGVVVITLSGLALLSAQRTPLFGDPPALWRQTVRCNPAAWIARVELATAELRRGDAPTAVAELRRAVAAAPHVARVHHRLAVALASAGQPAEALSVFDTARHLAPDDPEIANDLANLLAEEGQATAALTLYDAALARTPHNTAILINQANLLRRLGRAGEAEQRYERALASAPDSAAAHNGVGSLRLDQGRFAEAAQAFATASRLAPRDADYRANWGLAQLRGGDAGAARATLAAALELDPRHAVACNLLGLAQLASGDLRAAQNTARRGRELGVALQPELERLLSR